MRASILPAGASGQQIQQLVAPLFVQQAVLQQHTLSGAAVQQQQQQQQHLPVEGPGAAT
jgi:hypothetical protein